jgi:hypothetical protein
VKHIKPILIAGFLFLLSIGTGITNDAQTIGREVVSSGGGTSQSTSIVISSTIGEPLISNLYTSDSTRILTQGFQQPLVILIGPLTINTSEVLKIEVFPNPVVTKLTVEIEATGNENYVFKIVNLKGEEQLCNYQIVTQNNLQKRTEIDFAQLSKGTYIIRVFDITLKNELGTFKVVKID